MLGMGEALYTTLGHSILFEGEREELLQILSRSVLFKGLRNATFVHPGYDRAIRFI